MKIAYNLPIMREKSQKFPIALLKYYLASKI